MGTCNTQEMLETQTHLRPLAGSTPCSGQLLYPGARAVSCWGQHSSSGAVS